jgi:hypothetical protein
MHSLKVNKCSLAEWAVLEMSEIRNKIREAVNSGFAPLLKSAGYRKNGFNFRQDVTPSVFRLVNVQCSQWDTQTKGEFTVNLGVYHSDLAALHPMLPVTDSPLVKDCVVQERLGFLMPRGKDFWWTIRPDSDAKALGTRVAAAWNKYGRPWLELNSSLPEARKFLLGRNHFFLAAMASHALGQKSETLRWLSKAIEDWPEGEERIEAWRRRHLGSRR